MFTFAVENIPAQVNQGDPITVRMRVRGQGNLKSIKAPEFASTAGMKTYEKSRAELTDTAAVFEQVLMLNDPEIKALPALTFSYFNPQTAKYESITRGPFPVAVTPNGTAAAQVVTEIPAVAARTEIVGQDIIYLKAVPQTWRRLDQPFWYKRPLALMLLPVPAGLVLLIGLILQAARKWHSDPAEVRKRGAARSSNPLLKAAAKAAKQDDSSAFFAELWRAICTYFGHKLKLGAGEIDGAALVRALNRVGVDTAEVEQFKQLLGLCEQSRYGIQPEMTRARMLEGVRVMESVIKQCERKLK
jgi:hypothetical protein